MPFDSASWANPESKPRVPVPTFEPRTTRLDYRPVAWSLRYRPDDWRLVEKTWLVHMPSQHAFYVSGGSFFLYGSAGHCSCGVARNRASFADWVRARLAFRSWRTHGETMPAVPSGLLPRGPLPSGLSITGNQIAAINQQFAGHFLTA